VAYGPRGIDVFGGNLVAIVIVLFFVFLTMGALVSVVQELVAQLVRARSRSLRRCIRSMLQDDTYQDRIFNRVYRHPRIASAGKKVRNLTYIDANDFAIALATAIQPNDSGDDAICALPDSILALHEGKLKQRLRLAMPDVFRADRNPDQIKAAVASWYNAQMNTTSEQFRIATRVRLYTVAAIVTVLLNVSPIKIVEYLMARPELAQQFALVVPELAEKVYSTSENTLAALNAAPETTAETAGAQGVAGLPTNLNAGDFKTLLTFYECKRGINVLPIGWPWMAHFAEQVDKRKTSIMGAGPSQAEACGRALASSDVSPAVQDRLQSLGIAYIPKATTPAATTPTAAPTTVAPIVAPAPSAPAVVDPAVQPMPVATAPTPKVEQALVAKYTADFQPVYGPDPARDPWIYVILGWLITMVAAAQGAPFWFDLLRKLVSRK